MERTDLWHMFCCLYFAVTIERSELSAWESSDSKPQRGTDTPAPQIHARSSADRPDGPHIISVRKSNLIIHDFVEYMECQIIIIFYL